MPTYAYACTTCDHRFEAQQSFTDDALTECPECAGRLRKLFNSVGIVFKGSGFYRTDSRSDSAASTNGSGGSKDGKNGDSAGSSDSKSSGSATKSGDTKAAASSGSTSSGSTSSGSAA